MVTATNNQKVAREPGSWAIHRWGTGEPCGASSRQPRPMNFRKDIVQRLGDVPTRIMCLHFGQIADITDVVALAISVDILPDHLFTGHLFGELERLKDGTTVAATA